VFEFAPEILAALAFAGFIAGFIDAIAGGGGLVTVPALLLAGATPIETLGTNKAQSVFGSASATLSYTRAKLVDPKAQLPMATMSFGGAVLGAIIASQVPQEIFRAVLPFVLIAIALYFAFKPKLSDADSAERVKPFLFSVTVVPLLGFYDGVFGPGTGSFFMLAFVSLAGFGLLRATANTKLLNFASNFGGLVVFAIMGVVLWKTALIMGVAQFAGARLGARFAVKNGAKIIKPLLVMVCITLAMRLGWQSWLS
jgi:uncharacterized protein